MRERYGKIRGYNRLIEFMLDAKEFWSVFYASFCISLRDGAHIQAFFPVQRVYIFPLQLA